MIGLPHSDHNKKSLYPIKIQRSTKLHPTFYQTMIILVNLKQRGKTALC